MSIFRRENDNNLAPTVMSKALICCRVVVHNFIALLLVLVLEALMLVVLNELLSQEVQPNFVTPQVVEAFIMFGLITVLCFIVGTIANCWSEINDEKALYRARLVQEEAYRHEVTRFIYRLTHHKSSLPDDAMPHRFVDVFVNGFCLHFARLLQSTFDRGCVVWVAGSDHFVWVDTDGEMYDARGRVTSAYECETLVPVHELSKDALAGYQHDAEHDDDTIAQYRRALAHDASVYLANHPADLENLMERQVIQ